MAEKIFLFITFIGMVTGVAMMTTKDTEKNNITFFITCLITTFFSVLNLLGVQPKDYIGLIYSLAIILFGLSGMILRFVPIKSAELSPTIIFLTMLLSVIGIFK